MMMHMTLNVDGLEIELTRKSIKNMYVRVRPQDGCVTISAPQRMPQRQIVEFVRQHRVWIDKQRRKAAESDRPTFSWTDERKREAQRAIESALPALLAKWGPIIGRKPTHITLRLMTSRWGSCTPATGRIRLNLQLGLMDPRFLEYVLVHEMTHLWARGHGAEFQRRMSSYLPDWRQLRRELNRQGIV